jgi:uncharacterized protein
MRLSVAIVLTVVSPWAIAQPHPGSPSVPRPRPSTIQVTGQAQVSEAPDRVYIDIGVMTQAPKSQAAASQNAQRLSAVIAAVKRAAGSGAQLATTEYSINPNYNYPREGGTPTLVGYTVSNVAQVRLDDLRKIASVIDAATQAGSNNVQDIRFALRDEEAPREEALREAARNARQHAESLADALGLRIVRVLTADEESPAVGPRPIYPQARQFVALSAARAPTPVEAGTLEVSATVTLTVEVAPAKR